MSSRTLPFVALAGSVLLASCASPYFVHDPRTIVVDRGEVPRLLKSLRCELITYIAANNQRHILFDAEAKLHGIRAAAEQYQYYEIAPKSFGAIALSLTVQDSVGLTSGTEYEWYRSNDGGAHSHSWTFGPAASDQSAYTATWDFVVPQDALVLRPAPPTDSEDAPFSCYAQIPKRPSPPFGSVYAEEDIDALARNDFPDYALFKRILVNNATPLAAWLEDVGSSITKPTMGAQYRQQKPYQIIPALMQYQFEVVVSGGLGVTYGLTSPLWTVASTGVTGSVQKTNTMTIYLNGLEGQDWVFATADGGAKNNEAHDLPVINVNVSAPDLPEYVGRKRPRGQPLYPLLILSPQQH